ncbi:hypothetical protein [Streptomyces sp. NPDC057877]|uniref:hypothetical protein n=1 Tax=Streptomyces sp. NPDC057877 TaxID=3346269 RepID=UPI0036BA2053
MIKQFHHTDPGTAATATDPAGYALALEVAHTLHAPRTRPPELAPAAHRPRTTRRRTAVRG